jgi:hypothetical protein
MFNRQNMPIFSNISVKYYGFKNYKNINESVKNLSEF